MVQLTCTHGVKMSFVSFVRGSFLSWSDKGFDENVLKKHTASAAHSYSLTLGKHENGNHIVPSFSNHQKRSRVIGSIILLATHILEGLAYLVIIAPCSLAKMALKFCFEHYHTPEYSKQTAQSRLSTLTDNIKNLWFDTTMIAHNIQTLA